MLLDYCFVSSLYLNQKLINSVTNQSALTSYTSKSFLSRLMRILLYLMLKRYGKPSIKKPLRNLINKEGKSIVYNPGSVLYLKEISVKIRCKSAAPSIRVPLSRGLTTPEHGKIYSFLRFMHSIRMHFLEFFSRCTRDTFIHPNVMKFILHKS